MEGIAGLGINLPTLLAQVVNVAILLVVLYFVAYRPVMRMLDQRSNRIKESMEQADAAREEAARSEEEMKKQLEKASKEAQQRIAQAVQAGEGIKEKALASARQEAEALVNRARGDGASSMPRIARQLRACNPEDPAEQKTFFRFKNFLYKTVRIH